MKPWNEYFFSSRFFFPCISEHCVMNSNNHTEVTVNSYLSASYLCENVVTKAVLLTFPLNFPKCDEELKALVLGNWLKLSLQGNSSQFQNTAEILSSLEGHLFCSPAQKSRKKESERSKLHISWAFHTLLTTYSDSDSIYFCFLCGLRKS